MVVSILLSILTVAVLFFIYTALGYSLLRMGNLTFPNGLLRLLVGCGLGYGVVGNCIMALCFIHQAKPVVIISCIGVWAFVGMPGVRRVFSDVKRISSSAIHVLGSAPWFSRGLLLILVGGYMVRGLLPPAGFDGLMYHLSTAKLYLQQGGFWNIYFNAQSDYPMLTEMHYMIGMVFRNDTICKTIAGVLGLMTLATIAVLCVEYCEDRKLVVPSLLVFCTFTTVIANMSNCDVDIPQALWTMMAVLSMEYYIRKRSIGYLFISAVFAGMAMETKIFGVFVLPILFVRLLIERKQWRVFMAQKWKLGVAALVPVAMASPWYLKSYFYNQTILSIRHASIVAQGLADPMGVHCTSPLWYWLINAVVRPLAALWTFSLFPGQHCGDTFGPLFLAVLPFWFFIKGPKKSAILLLLTGVYLVQLLIMEIWFIQGGTTIRYSMFILMAGAPCIIWTTYHISEFTGIQKILRAMVIGMVCLGAVLFVKRYHKEWIAFFMLHDRDAYYLSVLPEYPVIKRINNLADGKTVMPVYNYSDYLIEVPYITAYRPYHSLEDMKNDFREKNIGYVFANDKLDITKNRGTFPELAGKEIVDSTNGFYLFRLPADRTGLP